VLAPEGVDFLRHLHRHLPGPRTIIWDRSTLHDKSLVVRVYLAEHPEIVTEKFPGYAQDLNPDEFVWSYIKYGRLANLGAENTNVLFDHWIDTLVDVRENRPLMGPPRSTRQRNRGRNFCS